MTYKILNKIKLFIFVILLGITFSVVLWIFLFLVNKGTELLWQVIPGTFTNFQFYPLIVCVIGGLIIGLFRKKFGDYPENMNTVIATVKKNKTYPYKKMPVLLISALLPLIFGSSIGPEAGMVGVIVGLCFWISENLKFAQSQAKSFSELGISVTLSTLFYAPLFGLFQVEENEKKDDYDLPTVSKVLMYIICAASGIGCFSILNKYVINISEGFPTLEFALPEGWDYVLIVLYIAVGIALGWFFSISENMFGKISTKLPCVVQEVICGVVLGLAISFMPMLGFSGKTQLEIFVKDYAVYAPITMIGIAILKILATSMCIKLGWKGGHIFPLIFATVCMGYGISLLIFPSDILHASFAAAIVTSATMGFVLKKPLAVTFLLFLCFPIRMLIWLLLTASIASFVAGKIPEKFGCNLN